MLSAIQVNQSAVSSTEGASGQAVPETGEFDFLSYLLGLQATDTEVTGTENSEKDLGALLSGKSEEKKSEKGATNLAALFPAFNIASPSISTEVQGAETSTVAKAPWQSLDAKTGTDGDARNVDAQADSTVGMVTEPNLLNAQAFKGQIHKDTVLQKYAENTSKNGAEAEAASAMNAANETLSRGSDESGAANQLTPVAHGLVHSDNLDKRSLKLTSMESSFALPVSQLMNGANDSGDVSNAESPRNAEHPTTDISELFTRVDSLVQKGGGNMTVTLDPPDLGRLEIKVSTKGRRVEVEMTSEREFTKSLLESRFSELKQSIQSQDLHVSRLEVRTEKEAGTAFPSTAFSLAGGHEFNDSRGFSDSSQSRRAFTETRDTTLSSRMSPTQTVSSFRGSIGSGRVDMRI